MVVLCLMENDHYLSVCFAHLCIVCYVCVYDQLILVWLVVANILLVFLIVEK